MVCLVRPDPHRRRRHCHCRRFRRHREGLEWKGATAVHAARRELGSPLFGCGKGHVFPHAKKLDFKELCKAL